MLFGAGLAGALAACASPGVAPEGVPADPLEPVNRPLFAFNDAIGRYALEPLARGYDWLLPDPVQQAIGRFFDNVAFPVNAGNDLLQGSVREAGIHTGRFLVNTTVGVAGFFDPAMHLGWEAPPEDFGQTLGVWGIARGPYLVLPFFGPRTLRHAAAMPVNGAMAVYPFFVPFGVSAGADAGWRFNWLSLHWEDVRDAREEAFDYYVFVRNAYLQRREAALRDGGPEEPSELEEEAELYWPDENEAPEDGKGETE